MTLDACEPRHFSAPLQHWLRAEPRRADRSQSWEDQAIATIKGNRKKNKLAGSSTNDSIFGRGDDDVLIGRGGNDRLFGESGDDTLKGGAGNDRLTGGQGNDVLNGGSGTDRAIFSGASSEYDITLAAGGLSVVHARGTAADGTDFVAANVEFLQFSNMLVDLRADIAHILSAPVVDLSTISLTQGFVIQGDAAEDGAGKVSGAGDINGDGFDDIIVGGAGGDDGGELAGEAYVLFGAAAGFGVTDPITGRQVIDLTNLSREQGFIIQGDASDDRAGGSVSDAGDINGDGFDDLVIGASSGDDGGENAGEAYIVFGFGAGFGVADPATGRQVIDLSTLSADQGFVIQGDRRFDNAGNSVSTAGDVNGDGFDDLVIGASGGNDGGHSAGEAYVVFGSNAGFGVTDPITGRQIIDLTCLSL